MTPNGSSRPGLIARLFAYLGSAITAGDDSASAEIDSLSNEIGAQAESPSFERQKYAIDRAHELELNKFTHTFEVERLKILLILNGGAFTVAAAFATTLTQGHGPGRWLALVAIVLWIAGLAAAAWAIQQALDLQAAFTQAYHNRRRSNEWRLLADDYPTKEDRSRVVPIPLSSEGELTVDTVDLEYNRRAETYRKTGDLLKPKVRAWAKWSVGLFVGGAGLMVAAIGIADTQKPTAELTLTLRR